MKNVFVEAMRETFDLSAMLGKIDYHHIRGSLTDAEREELVAIARSKANPMGGVDVLKKLQEMEERLKALEEKAKESDGESGVDAIPEYQMGKWYYAGDKVSFGGETYLCIAPAGQVCTWSPADYPAYWEKQ